MNSITTLILCGGQALRMKGHFDDVPKPLIKIQDKHLLEYIMNGYLKYGVKKFILLVGNDEELFLEFARNFQNKEVKIIVLQTGLNTPTGGRIKKAEALLIQEEYFFLTYGDGISNVNFNEQLKFHKAHQKTVTITAVKPNLPFGLLNINEDNSVVSFIEKPIMNDLINGGFFVLNKQIFDYLNNQSDFEKDILTKMSNLNELKAFSHNGFWKNMDTYKDYLTLEELSLNNLLV